MALEQNPAELWHISMALAEQIAQAPEETRDNARLILAYCLGTGKLNPEMDEIRAMLDAVVNAQLHGSSGHA